MDRAPETSPHDRYLAKIEDARACAALFGRRTLKHPGAGRHQQTLDMLIAAAEARVRGTRAVAVDREDIRNLLLAIEPVPPDLRHAFVLLRWLVVQAGVLPDVVAA